MSFYYSLTDYDGVTPPKFIGIQNYIDLFTNGDFGEALWHTVYFTIGTVPLGTILAILVAVLLNQKIRGLNLYKTAFSFRLLSPTPPLPWCGSGCITTISA